MSKRTTATSVTKTSVQKCDELAPEDNYQAVKLNAMTHGILSRHTVLSHEDQNEYSDLLSLLTQEHKPQGITESHLIEELTGIIWRKQRVLQAEGARINEGIKLTSRNTQSVLSASLPFNQDITSDDVNLTELLRLTPDEITDLQNSAKEELQSLLVTEQRLESMSLDYNAAVAELSEDDLELWSESLDTEESEATQEDLLEFIQEHLKPWYENQLAVATHHAEIKAQALGQGVQPHKLEPLNRYETHLDRKFQRTLAMLIKLKDLRNC
jgi:hypothetical protein